jgi:hypothetical protein
LLAGHVCGCGVVGYGLETGNGLGRRDGGSLLVKREVCEEKKEVTRR